MRCEKSIANEQDGRTDIADPFYKIIGDDLEICDDHDVCLRNGQTVVRWTRRRAVPAYAPNLTFPDEKKYFLTRTWAGRSPEDD